MTQALLKERSATHGDFKKQFSLSQLIKGAIAEHGTIADPVVSEAVDHMIVKLTRIATGDPMFVDHWKDIAGYGELVVRHLEAEQPARAGFTIADVIDREYNKQTIIRHPMTKCVSYTDGGGWFFFNPEGNEFNWPVCAIKFEDGSEWDYKQGWRKIP